MTPMVPCAGVRKRERQRESKKDRKSQRVTRKESKRDREREREHKSIPEEEGGHFGLKQIASRKERKKKPCKKTKAAREQVRENI